MSGTERGAWSSSVETHGREQDSTVPLCSVLKARNSTTDQRSCVQGAALTLSARSSCLAMAIKTSLSQGRVPPEIAAEASDVQQQRTSTVHRRLNTSIDKHCHHKPYHQQQHPRNLNSETSLDDLRCSGMAPAQNPKASTNLGYRKLWKFKSERPESRNHNKSCLNPGQTKQKKPTIRSPRTQNPYS